MISKFNRLRQANEYPEIVDRVASEARFPNPGDQYCEMGQLVLPKVDQEGCLAGLVKVWRVMLVDLGPCLEVVAKTQAWATGLLHLVEVLDFHERQWHKHLQDRHHSNKHLRLG